MTTIDYLIPGTDKKQQKKWKQDFKIANSCTRTK